MFHTIRTATLFFILFFITAVTAISQEVQWANELLRYSSQYGQKAYAAKQVLGKPNKLPDAGASPVAWAPAKPDSRFPEYVRVKYKTAIHVQQIAIAENLNPGAVYQVILYDTRGKQHKVYENKDLIVPLTPGSRVFRIMIDRTGYMVNELKLILHPAAIPGMNQIDAIGIADSQIPVHAKINLVEAEEYTGKAENLGPAINSEADDMLPIISADGQSLYFGRKLHPENIGADKADDIWYSTRNESGQWTKAINPGAPLNNEYHNYVAAVSTDGNQLVLANEYSRFGIPAQGVAISTRSINGWSQPKNLRIKSFYNLNEFSCYHMGPQGRVLLMAIEQHDTYGDMDIYVSFKEDGLNWTEPLNLGPSINTAATEGSVFLAADGKTIYFSSDGFSGYGSFDMYMSRRLDDTWTNWTEPINLGPQINSRLRDFYYTIPASGDYAYFSSDKNSYGRSDIYRIKLPREVRPLPVTLLHANITDAITHEPIDVNIHFEGNDTGYRMDDIDLEDGRLQVIIPKQANLILSADIPGYFPIFEPVNRFSPIHEIQFMDYNEHDLMAEMDRELRLEMTDSLELVLNDKLQAQNLDQIRLEYHIDNSEQVNTTNTYLPVQNTNPDSLKNAMRKDVEQEIINEILEQAENDRNYSEVIKDIEAVPIRAGEIIRIDNIYFDANRWYLRPESDESLDKIVDFLEKNPNIKVEIGGHTNSLPSDDFCNKLSENRAKRVARYIIDHGIKAERISWKGYGKSVPIADNHTKAGRRKNQRVELKIISIQ